MTRVARSNFDGIECKDFSKCLPGGRDRSGFTTLHNGCKAYIKLHFHKKLDPKNGICSTLGSNLQGPSTLPMANISSVKNLRAWVSMVFT